RLRPAQLGEAVGDLPDLGGERRRLWRYAHAPLRTAPEREHVLDERGQATRLLVDDLQSATPLDVAAHPPEQQRPREHPDLRQRGAQLVRDARYEVAAQLHQLRLA